MNLAFKSVNLTFVFPEMVLLATAFILLILGLFRGERRSFELFHVTINANQGRLPSAYMEVGGILLVSKLEKLVEIHNYLNLQCLSALIAISGEEST